MIRAIRNALPLIRERGWWLTDGPKPNQMRIGKILGSKHCVLLFEETDEGIILVDNALKTVYRNKVSHFLSNSREWRFVSNKDNFFSVLVLLYYTGFMHPNTIKHILRFNPWHKGWNTKQELQDELAQLYTDAQRTAVELVKRRK